LPFHTKPFWYTLNPAFGRVALVLFGLALAVGILVPGHAARASINWVQDNAVTGQTTVTASVAFVSNNSARNLIVVATDFPFARSLVQVKDTAGNTYAKAMTADNSSATLEIWYAKNIVGGANTVKVGLDAAAGANFDVYIHEYSGADLVSPLDVTASSIGSSAALDSGSATTNFPNELIFGFGINNAATLSTPGSTFTGRRTDGANITEDKTATTVGSYSATATINIAADWTMAMATFKPTAVQGVQISSRSDTLSDSRPSATSNHTIAFTSNNSFNTISTNATSTLTLAFPSGFSLSNIFCKDVDISFGGTATSIAGNFANRSTSKNCPGTATTWGLFVDTSANALTFYTPTAAAIYVATGTQVQIKIGSNASFQESGTAWITNPSTAGVYTISVGGTFGGSGNMLVSINAGVSVQATVAESLSLSVSSIGALSCTADDGATITAIGTAATSVPFGIISPNTFYQGCQDLIVSTNAGNGYSVTVQESSAMRTVDGRFAIPDTTCDAGDCTVATATTWVTPTKNGFGHTCFNQSGSDCNPTYGSGKKFMPLSNIVAGNNGATIKFVQSASVADSSVPSLTKSFTTNNIAGNLIVVSSGWNVLGSTASISDTQGNLYATAVGPIANSGGGFQGQVWYAKNIKGGANTVTVAYNNIIVGEIMIHEYSGLDIAGDYAAMGRLEEAVRETNLAVTLRPNEATVLYNAACVFCSTNKKSEALDAIRKAWEAGFKDPEWARRDPDLELLHGDPEFERLYPEKAA
jgi:hypothetical protein